MAKQNKPYLFCDLDGVLYDWTKGACKLMDVDPTDPEIRKIIKEDWRGVELVCGEEKLGKAITDAGSEYWEDLELYPWAKKLYRKLSEKADVHFLTSNGSWEDAPAGKVKAVKRDFNTSRITITINKPNSAVPNSILIDDKPKNVEEFKKAGGEAYLWPNQYLIEDGDLDSDDVIDECLQAVDKMLNKIGD